jgi:hypothetical protein
MTQKRYRLLAHAQLDGEVRQAGYVFTLAEGERGPHKGHSRVHPQAAPVGRNRFFRPARVGSVNSLIKLDARPAG